MSFYFFRSNLMVFEFKRCDFDLRFSFSFPKNFGYKKVGSKMKRFIRTGIYWELHSFLALFKIVWNWRKLLKIVQNHSKLILEWYEIVPNWFQYVENCLKLILIWWKFFEINLSIMKIVWNWWNIVWNCLKLSKIV